ncbi:hypothetical protein Ahy_A09g046303 [Arachis hypogaea]|uniref:Uncharacterized protein n=1 Tax=Arachis hypogaea TaxID=3818 RepID=A0A445BPE8_ARAHY|nr:hypothetical protein Ahy_A09g046303 [Arachis hypogaea]
MELSMSVRRTIENNEKVSIRPSKTYQSFVAVAGGHRELNFIKKDVRNYTTREVRNVSKLEIFGSFVEMNHHGQSTLLGCALMKNEDIQSF